MVRFSRLPFMLALAPIVVACSELYDPEPERLLFEVGEISTVVGEWVEVTVAVTTTGGDPLEGVEVQWTTYQALPSGNTVEPIEFWKHSLEPGVTRTDRNGRTRAVLVPPTKGKHQVVASVDRLSASATVLADFSPTAPTRLVWRLLPAMPGGRSLMAGASFGDRVYLIGGTDGRESVLGAPLRSSFIFDRTSELWTEGARPLTAPPGNIFGVAASLNDGVHFISGRRHYLYVPASNAWSELAAAADSATDGVLEAVAGKLYLVSRSGAVNAFDPATQSWSTRARMPTPRSQAASAVLDGRIYVAGGRPRLPCSTAASDTVAVCGYSGTSVSFERYDPATNTWSVLAPMPFPRVSFAAAALGGSVCVFGGGQGVNRGMWMFKETYCYEPAANAWTLEAPIPYDLVSGISVVEYGGAVDAFGGNGRNLSNFLIPTNQAARLSLR